MSFLMMLQKVLGPYLSITGIPLDGGDEDEVDNMEAVRVVLLTDIFSCIANKKHSDTFLTEKWMMLQKTLNSL